MRVAVSVHGRFHAFDLAAQLHRRNMLAGVVTTYPTLAARRFLPQGIDIASAAWLEVWRRAHGRLKLPGSPDYRIARAFGRFAARALPPADLVVGWSGASLEMIGVARSMGARVVIERGSTHIDHQSDVLREAHGRLGLTWAETDPRLADRERAEYEQADAIALGSRAAFDSFVERGVPVDRLIVNPYGVDLDRFRVGPVPKGDRRRLLFVGSVGVRKGVAWLLRAFARLPKTWDLHLVGPVERGFDAVMAREPMDRVVVRGPVPGADLPGEYAAADIFCLPSVEEGFGLVILQAMAAGLPVVASTATGLMNADPGQQAGRLVPPMDETALAQALAELAGDEGLRQSLGAQARQAVVSGFSWDDYGERAVAAYFRLTGDVRPGKS